MDRLRRKRRRRQVAAFWLLMVLGGVGGGWWYLHGRHLVGPRGTGAAPAGAVSAASVVPIVEAEEEPFLWGTAVVGSPAPVAFDELLQPVSGPPSPPEPPAATRPAVTPAPPPNPAAADGPRTLDPAVERARRLHDEGRLLQARHELNELLRQATSPTVRDEARRLLTTLAEETIFSPRRIPDDPLTDTYTVKPGDVFVRIGPRFKVPAEVLMRINGIKQAASLRADQRIKVVRGPFRVQIHKSQFRLDVYLQDVYVRSFRVGLGGDQGTPEGVWRVKERLQNPTYYPPPSAPIKRIIPPDDPQNPLGEHWIGLEGVSGDALGHEGYGIHGTIEPESIGKAVSLGCVRMYNEDVEFLYSLLLPGESTVTILP